jgi:filamentous hemagglutinin family protein
MRDRMRELRQTLETGLVLMLVGFMAVGPWAPRAWAGPELQEVVSGEIDLQVDGNTTTIESSAVSIGNYGNFDIGTDELVNVLFSGMDNPENGRHLARVMNGLETQILGELFSPGHVYIVNPAGLFIGAGGSIDVAGFHAAAGDIVENAFLDDNPGNDHYTNLVGEVRNYGEINAKIVDLVGRYVLNAEGASIHHDDPTDDLALDGFFVLVAGHDVIITRSAPADEAAAARGEMNVTVRITGLARELLDALDSEEKVGVEQNGMINANNADASDQFEQASVGQVVLGAAAELGSGDLAGMVMFGSQSETLAQNIIAMARGGDVEIADVDSDGDGVPEGPGAQFDAESVELCAGEICDTGFVNLPIGEDIENPGLARVEIGNGAHFNIRKPRYYEPEEQDENTPPPPGPGDLVGQFTLRQDADLEVDLQVGTSSDPDADIVAEAHSADPQAPLVDLDIESLGKLGVTGKLQGREITLVAGLDSVRSEDLVLDPAGVTLRGEVITLSAGDGIGQLSDDTEDQASILGLDETSFEFVDYRPDQDADGDDGVRQTLTLEQDASILVGSDEADSPSFDLETLSNSTSPGDLSHDLVLVSADELEVDGFDLEAGENLTVDRLTLRSGSDNTGDLTIGEQAHLNADQFLLEAGTRQTASSSAMTIDPNATFAPQAGEQIERFHVFQHMDIGAEALPQFLSGQTAPAIFKMESFRGRVEFDAAAAGRILGLPVSVDSTPENPTDDVYRGEQTELILSTGSGSIWVQPSLELKGLSVGDSDSALNFVTSASLDTQGDMSFRGFATTFGSEDRDTDAEAGDQSVYAGGTLSFRGAVRKLNGGSLILQAEGEPSDPNAGPGSEETWPIRLEAGLASFPNVFVENGDLEIRSSFVTEGVLWVGVDTSAPDGEDPYTLTIEAPDESGELVGEFRCISNCEDVANIRTGLLSIGANGSSVTLRNRVLSLDDEQNESWLPGGALNVSTREDLEILENVGFDTGKTDEAEVSDRSIVRLASEGAITFKGKAVADGVEIHAGTDGAGDLIIGGEAGEADAQIVADEMTLRAGASFTPEGEAPAQVVFNPGLDFQTSSFSVIEDATISSSMLPDVDAFGGAAVLDYSVESTRGTVEIVEGEQNLDGRIGEGWNLWLAAYDSIQVLGGLAANTISIHAGKGNLDRADLVLGTEAVTPTLRSAAIQLRAGVGDDNATETQSEVVVNGLNLIGRGAQGESLELTIQQDAAIDEETSVQDVAAIVNSGPDMTYILISDQGGIDLSDAGMATKLGSGQADGANLVLEAAEDIHLGTDLSFTSLKAHAGTSGEADSGDLIIQRTIEVAGGNPIEAEMTLLADEFELVAAAELPEGQEREPLVSAEQAPTVVIGEQVRFGAPEGGERIAAFTIEQDASVVDGQLTATHFELEPGSPIVPDALRLASLRGDVEVLDTALISGTKLDIEALGGASLGAAGSLLALQSLKLVTGEGATLHRSISATGDGGSEAGSIEIQGDAEFDGTGQRVLAAAGGGRIGIDGNLVYRPADNALATLVLSAAGGQVEVTGAIDTSADRASVEPRNGADLRVQAGEVALGAIATSGAAGGDGGEVSVQADEVDVGTITTSSGTGRGGDVAIAGSTSVRLREGITTFDNDLRGEAGDVTLTAGVIEIGSAIETDSETEFQSLESVEQNVKIVAGDVTFDGRVIAPVSVLLDENGLPVAAEDVPEERARRNLDITSESGLVEFTGEVGNEEQDGRLDRISVRSASDVSFQDRVWLREREQTAGRLAVEAERDVRLGGEIVAGTVDAHAGMGEEESSTQERLPGSGTLEVEGDITADEIVLRVGNGLGEGDQLDDELGFADGVGFLGRGAALAPVVRLQQEAEFDADTTDQIILERILAANGIVEERPDVRVDLVSDAGTTTVRGSTVAGMRLKLGGDDSNGPGVIVNGPLEVRELDLASDATINGSLSVTGPSTKSDVVIERAGLRLAGDLNVAGGDLELLTLIRLYGEQEGTQMISVQNGGILAPALERRVTEDDGAEVVIRARDGVELRGTLRESSFASGIQSADLGRGSLSFESDVLALGHLEARNNLTFAEGTDLEIQETYLFDGQEARTVSHDQIILARDGELVVDGPVAKQGSSGSWEDGSLVFGGGSGFEIRQSDPRPISAVADLTLVGLGEIGGAAGPVTIESEQGKLQLIGGLARSGADLTLAAGEGEEILLAGTIDAGANAVRFENAVRTDREAAEKLADAIERDSVMPEESRPDSALVLGGRVDFMDTIKGDASLSVGGGSMELHGDVEMGHSATLTLNSRTEGGIRFSKPEQDGEQLVRAGSIELNPDGHETTPRANIVRTGGDLHLEATDDHFTMGAGTRMSVVGDLSIDAARSAQLADLSAFEIDVTAPVIGVISRPPAVVERPDGSTVLDSGTDIIANRIAMSTEPLNLGGGLVSFGTPTGTEISDEIWSADTQVRAIYPSLRPLVPGDFVCGDGTCDLVALGAARIEAGRELEREPRPVGLQGRQALAELNMVGVAARPLWAEELLAHVAGASLGGGALRSVQTGDPRLSTPAVAEAVRIYRNLFAPTVLYDETTGTTEVRSHHERIREVLDRAIEAYRAVQPGAPLGGAGFGAFLEANRYDEALFYLSTLGDLVSEARRAGLTDEQAEHFAQLLAEDITPDGVAPSDLAAAILASEAAA